MTARNNNAGFITARFNSVPVHNKSMTRSQDQDSDLERIGSGSCPRPSQQQLPLARCLLASGPLHRAHVCVPARWVTLPHGTTFPSAASPPCPPRLSRRLRRVATGQESRGAGALRRRLRRAARKRRAGATAAVGDSRAGCEPGPGGRTTGCEPGGGKPGAAGQGATLLPLTTGVGQGASQGAQGRERAGRCRAGCKPGAAGQGAGQRSSHVERLHGKALRRGPPWRADGVVVLGLGDCDSEG
jgi:hypothetical protein